MKQPIRFLIVSILISLNFACQPNQSILNSGKSENSATATNQTARPKDTLESALGSVQRSGFSYIFVIRRKDGGQFTKEDKTYVRENSPPETNQFVLTDEDRVIIVASNYPSLVDSLEIWRKVFNVEDFSPAKDENANGANNANANSATNNNSNSATKSSPNSKANDNSNSKTNSVANK